MSTETDRPESLTWGTDAVYADPGTDWDGLANKIEPAASKKAEGILPDEQPDSTEWNWWRNAVARFCSWVEGIQLANWGVVLHDSFVSWIGGGLPLQVRPHDICHDSGSDTFTAIDQGAITIISTDPGAWTSAPGDHPGGQGDAAWAEESANPQGILGAGHASAEVASNQAGRRVAVGNGPVGGVVAESPSIGTWNSRATVNAVSFHCVDFGGALFAIGGASGTIETSPTGVTWTSRTSGIADTIRLVRHNGLSGADALWLALSDTKWVKSADGVTWSSGDHSLGSIPLRLDYDAEKGIWMALLTNGDVATSSNGEAWTVMADLLGLSAGGFAPLLKYEVGLASDRQSGWVATFERYAGAHPTVTSITSRRWASKDGGLSWHRTYSPQMIKCQRGGVCFGGDRFVTAGDEGGNFSLRVLGS